VTGSRSLEWPQYLHLQGSIFIREDCLLWDV